MAKANPNELLSKHFALIESDEVAFVIQDDLHSASDFQRSFPENKLTIIPLMQSGIDACESSNLPFVLINQPSQHRFDRIVIMMQKSKPEMIMLLHWAAANLKQTGKIIVVGENDSGIRSIDRLTEGFGFTKIASGKHSIIVESHTVTDKGFVLDDWWSQYEINGLTVFNLPGVFSQDHLDKGTAFLLEHLPEKVGDRLLEFGCGSGSLAAHLLMAYPEIHLTTLDNQLWAVWSTEKTLAANQFTQRSTVLASNGLNLVKADSIILSLIHPFIKAQIPITALPRAF